MRIFSLILAVTGFVSLSSNARGDETIPPDVLAAIKKATVFVKVQVEGRSFSGSGFVVKVDDGAAYIVTNHHVIEPHLVEIVAEWRSGPRSRMPTVPHGPSGRNGPRTYAPPVRESPVLTPRFVARTLKNAEVTVVFQSGTPQEESLRAEVLAADPEVDLAILKAVDVKNLPIPVDCNRDVELTETMPVYSFGFPFGQVLATSKGSPAITIGKASISSLRRDDAGDLALVQIDGALNPGNSGGPVVDTRGRLVGVAVATIKNSTGIGLAIPCKKVPLMLEGRLGKPHLQLAQDTQGATTLQVEVNLVDPFHKIKSATLYYLAADSLKEKPAPADRLSALPGSRQLSLKMQDHVALGQVSVKKGVSRIRILYQGVCVDSDGRQRFTANVEETIDLPAGKAADDAVVESPPARPARELPEGDSPRGSHPSSPNPRRPTRPGERPPTENDLGGLVADLKSGEMGRRIRATLKLDGIKPQKPHPDVAAALEMVLLEDGHAFLRSHAARLLKTWGTPASIAALKKASRDSEPYVRDCAKEAIEDINAAAEHQDEDSSKRKGSQGSASSGRAKEGTAGRRSIGDLDLLLADLKSSNLGRRMHALLQVKGTMPQEPHPEVAKALETVLLEDGNVNLRVLAANGLKTWGTSENIPALKKALKDPESSVRHWAKQAIDGINRAAEDADKDSSAGK